MKRTSCVCCRQILGTDVLDSFQDIDITDEVGTRHVRDEVIELAETGVTFRRIVFEDLDGEKIAYVATFSPAEYDPVDVMYIYTLRTLIEILFRELKQHTNIENFYSQSVNCVLFELFCPFVRYFVRWNFM
ncbi:hypothetical protein ACLI4Q_06415 [Natrialbaceae archaeon A-CW1-1]